MKVYMTYKQSHITGQMVPDKCFLNKKDAEDYIYSKPFVKSEVRGIEVIEGKYVGFDPNFAPEGYFAVVSNNCETCAFFAGGECNKIYAPCIPAERPDGERVVFQQKIRINGKQIQWLKSKMSGE